MCETFGFAIVALMAFVVVELVQGSALSLARFGVGFVFEKVWDPVAEHFGAARVWI
jgi:phosphate transport system permease protein